MVLLAMNANTGSWQPTTAAGARGRHLRTVAVTGAQRRRPRLTHKDIDLTRGSHGQRSWMTIIVSARGWRPTAVTEDGTRGRRLRTATCTHGRHEDVNLCVCPPRTVLLLGRCCRQPLTTPEGCVGLTSSYICYYYIFVMCPSCPKLS